MELTKRQIDDLSELQGGALLVHQRSEARWYLYADGETASDVEAGDAALYLDSGWVERQGFEGSVNLELYALTEAGQEALEPYADETSEDAEDGYEDAPYLLLSTQSDGGQPALVLALPVDPEAVELVRRRLVLAQTLAAADEAFVALEYEADALILDPSLEPELAALTEEGYALLADLPEAWEERAEVATEWASVLISETGFSFAAGLEDGRRLETDALAEEDLVAVAMMVLSADEADEEGDDDPSEARA